MNCLLVLPRYYSKFPPLGLLKLSTYLKQKGHNVEFIKGCEIPQKKPNQIYVTSLFTWSWEVVHETILYYRRLFPYNDIILGGIYASLLPSHAEKSAANVVSIGVDERLENCIPDYSLIPDWDTNIVFLSRGCINHCGFCAVPKIEPVFQYKSSIIWLIDPNLKKISLWDNNFLANPNRNLIFDELEQNFKGNIDFNQGLDFSLIDSEIAQRLKTLNLKYVRLAYDSLSDTKGIQNAIEILKAAGIKAKSIFVYTLYNWLDNPLDLLQRINNMMNWGVCCYPMRYQPVDTLVKDSFVGKFWSVEQLNKVAKFRRVLGKNGLLLPYLKNKVAGSCDFNTVFSIE